MQIDRGLLDHMVLQRNARNVSDALVRGRCESAGPVVARVVAAGKALRGLAAARVGRAARGRFEARLRGLPAGGPYEVELSVGPERLAVRDVLVGDVWLLGGQSNMQGVGLLADAPKPEPLVRAFYMDDRWDVAAEPLHELCKAVDPVHAALGAARVKPPRPIVGVGPGLAFAREMRRRTGVPQGVIACGHGGTRMDQWDPKLKRLGGASLYGAMLRRFARNGSRVAGLVWYQGESDAGAALVGQYTRRMVDFVRALRRDVGDARLPVAMVQIGRVIGYSPEAAAGWNSVQEQQRRLPERIDRLAVVPAINLPLDDVIHVSGAAMHELGARLAEAMSWLLGGRGAAQPPIELDSVALKETRPGFGEIHVRFRNVVGALVAPGRPVGFSLATPLPTPGVFDVKLRVRTAIVRTIHSASALRGFMVCYGPGADPVCNITDQAGRSLPVFGPIAMGKARALTPFVRRLRVSPLLPSAGRLEKLRLPDLSKLKMASRSFAGDFCDLHGEIQQHRGVDELLVYACRIRCPERMRLKLELGYDGPVKAWVDGRMVVHDPAGANPATPADKASATFTASAGEHEIVVALGTNDGAAWGIFLRFERLDVPQRAVRQGPSAYTLPEILG